MADTGPKKSQQEISRDFKEEVEAEVVYLQQFPILDDTEKNIANLARKAKRAKARKLLRSQKGPLLTDEDEEAEEKRLKSLRLRFNREDAHRAKVKLEANISYQRWVTPILTKMSADADHEIFDLVCDKVGLKKNIERKSREMHEIAGNGNQ